jgi:hypothetical protein
MLPAARAIFIELEPVWVVAPILLGRVVPLLAFITLKRNDRADILLL